MPAPCVPDHEHHAGCPARRQHRATGGCRPPLGPAHHRRLGEHADHPRLDQRPHRHHEAGHAPRPAVVAGHPADEPQRCAQDHPGGEPVRVLRPDTSGVQAQDPAQRVVERQRPLGRQDPGQRRPPRPSHAPSRQDRQRRPQRPGVDELAHGLADIGENRHLPAELLDRHPVGGQGHQGDDDAHHEGRAPGPFTSRHGIQATRWAPQSRARSTWPTLSRRPGRAETTTARHVVTRVSPQTTPSAVQGPRTIVPGRSAPAAPAM